MLLWSSAVFVFLAWPDVEWQSMASEKSWLCIEIELVFFSRDTADVFLLVVQVHRFRRSPLAASCDISL
jgi:hypothetical protein